jgi:hypothetical protein
MNHPLRLSLDSLIVSSYGLPIHRSLSITSGFAHTGVLNHQVDRKRFPMHDGIGSQMAKSKSVSVPPTTLSPSSSMAQAAALRKPVKSVGTPAEPTCDVPGEPPNPHALATVAHLEALPKVTAAMDAIYQGKEYAPSTKEILSEVFSTTQQPKPSTSPEREKWPDKDWELAASVWNDLTKLHNRTPTPEELTAGLKQACQTWKNRNGKEFIVKNLRDGLFQHKGMTEYSRRRAKK